MDLKKLSGSFFPLMLPFGSCTIDEGRDMAVKVLCKGYLMVCGDADQVQLKKQDSHVKGYCIELFCTVG